MPAARERTVARVTWLGAITTILSLSLTSCQVPPENFGIDQKIIDRPVNVGMAAALPDSIQKGDEFVIATNAPYPPYEMFSAPGRQELTGLEIDLGTAIGAALGVQVRFVQQPFDGLVPGLQAGSYDAIMATLRATPEREEELELVNYATIGGTGLMVLAENNGVDGYEDLCGATVGVQNGAVQHELLALESELCQSEGKGAIDVRSYPNFTDIQLALFTSTVDVAIGDSPVLISAAAANENLRTFVDEDGPRASSEEGFVAIGLSKGSDELANAFLQALKELQEDGTYDAILDHYDMSFTAMYDPHISRLAEEN